MRQERKKEKGKRKKEVGSVYEALRSALLSSLLVTFSFLLSPSLAHAHNLAAKAVLVPPGRIQVEGWFEPGGGARGARVQVFRASGQLVVEGRLNDEGIFTLSYHDVEPLHIVVNAGAGHRAEAAISGELLGRDALCTCVACITPTPSPCLTASVLTALQLDDSPSLPPQPLVRRQRGTPYRNLLLGVSILVVIAALAVQWQRWQKLRAARGKAGLESGD
jgi:hypothetical protein